ncbi:nuclear transport factor 2 family protein [Verticiella sediminum]|uniref:Nuclear transport factor 2 family protein n=1 Tax=Verticiella sediminum TaxID=1247510 RepID=A0A556ACM1_9BURK|nr:nuclear transport factor 2 family protein [Verticiella sediminum]TSH90631.1 nuclear transport factor 2 family protein [Verticiella sediminum]
MSLPLPAPISTYFEISNGADIARIVRCFTQDALVVDESRTYRGHDAIQSWQREAQRKFEYTVEPVSVSKKGDLLTVTASVVGNFPGSPVQLDHVFALSGDKISSLEIG